MEHNSVRNHARTWLAEGRDWAKAQLNWVQSHLNGRGRFVAFVAAAVLGIGLVATGVAAAVGGGPRTPGPTAVGYPGSVDQRSSLAERADRSDRTSPSASPSASESAEPGTTTKPKKSTKPGSPTPSESKSSKAPSKRTPKPSPSTPKPRATTAAWVLPLPGAEITSCYGMRGGVPHQGIDFAMPAGTPIRAVGAGTVSASGWAYTGYGISVVVDHGNGYLTHYAHMNETAVDIGDRVKPGQVIGYEGSTGDSTGPHLHFEVHEGMWNQIEPADWLRAHGVEPGGC